MDTFLRTRFGECCRLLDRVLRYDRRCHRAGLLPVHMDDLACRYLPVRILLIALAHRLIRDEATSDQLAVLRRPLLETACRLMWFSEAPDRAAQAIYLSCRDHVSAATLRAGIQDATASGWMSSVPCPDELERVVVGTNRVDMVDYTWCGLAERHTGLDESHQLARDWRVFLDQVVDDRLLFYAQRHFLAAGFPAAAMPRWRDGGNEPALPWRVEHLVFPSAGTHPWMVRDPYQNDLYRWSEINACKRAWPVDEVESSGTIPALDRITSRRKMAASFLTPREFADFAASREIDGEQGMLRFAAVCGSRLVRIYREWWEAVVGDRRSNS